MNPPGTIGNADADLPPGFRVHVGGFAQAAQAGNGNPSPPPKWLWAMLMMFSMLVLRLQEEQYAESMRNRAFAAAERDPPFVWEADVLSLGNASLQTAFLSPLYRRTPSFLTPVVGAGTAFTGLGRVLATSSSGSAMEEPNAVAAGSGQLTLSMCPEDGRECIVAVQRAPLLRRVARAPQGSTCFRLLAGADAANLLPVSDAGGNRPLLCLRSRLLTAVVPAKVAGDDRLVVVWDPPRPPREIFRMHVESEAADSNHFEGNRSRLDTASLSRLADLGVLSDLAVLDGATLGPHSLSLSLSTCIAALSLPDLTVKAVTTVDRASTAIFDQATSLLLIIGFSASQMIVVQALDAETLEPKWRFRLPLTMAWVVRAPPSSDGFVLLIGSEEPFLGTVVVVDLKAARVYEQDPPYGPEHRRSPRRRLPRVHAESLAGRGSDVIVDSGLCGISSESKSRDAARADVAEQVGGIAV